VSVVTEGGRTRVELLRRTLEEREAEIAETNAKIAELARREDEAGLEALREAPTQRLYQLGSEGRSRPLKLRLEREKAEKKLAGLTKEADAVRAVLVEERAKERDGERQVLIAKAREFDAREREAWEKVVKLRAAFGDAVEDAWAVAEGREEYLRSLTFDDEAFRQEITGHFWSVQTPFPISPLRAFEIVEEVGRGVRLRRGGPLQEHAPDLHGVRSPLVQRAERSESTR
jgi:hypothetical protein